jgi:hypothetical protein
LGIRARVCVGGTGHEPPLGQGKPSNEILLDTEPEVTLSEFHSSETITPRREAPRFSQEDRGLKCD